MQTSLEREETNLEQKETKLTKGEEFSHKGRLGKARKTESWFDMRHRGATDVGRGAMVLGFSVYGFEFFVSFVSFCSK